METEREKYIRMAWDGLCRANYRADVGVKVVSLRRLFSIYEILLPVFITEYAPYSDPVLGTTIEIRVIPTRTANKFVSFRRGKKNAKRAKRKT